MVYVVQPRTPNSPSGLNYHFKFRLRGRQARTIAGDGAYQVTRKSRHTPIPNFEAGCVLKLLNICWSGVGMIQIYDNWH